MAQKNIGAILVFNEINIRYFSSYKFSDGFLLILQNRAFLVTDFRYYDEALNYASKEFNIVMPKNRWEFITDIISSEGVKNVGFEKSLSYGELLRLQERLPSFSFIALSDIFTGIRSVKRDDEIEKIAAAQGIADRAFSHILSVMTPEMTEIDVALELEFFMRKNGAEGVSFETIAISGDASALPHGKCRNIRLQKGFLTLDFGAVFCGYCSDMTRTVSIGRATEKMKEIYNTVLSAQVCALLSIKAGADCGETDKVARDIIDGAGYAGCFGHSLGHGVGMYIHESPNLSPSSFGVPLVSGNVVTVEPGIYVSGEMGVRIEDMVVVTDNGIRNLAKSPKELIELFC